jgi:MFS family permease
VDGADPRSPSFFHRRCFPGRRIGGLLLLGGRSGDLLGRRRVFIAGILVFSLASLLGGFATDQAWLLTARVVQGVGGAFAAPTALSLIAVTFPEGPPRNRAMGVYAGMSVAGGAVGLLASGLLLTYANWRWVFFVNVPIGLAVALLAPRVLDESERRRGRFDLPGAVTGSLGLAALVYGLSNAATTPDAVSHWGDTKVIVSLVAAAVLVVAFGFIEVRSKYALMPIRVLRSRDRSGAYLVSLCVGTALFGMFFFLTLLLQDVLGYSPLKTGVAYLPMAGLILVVSGGLAPCCSAAGTLSPDSGGPAASLGSGRFVMKKEDGGAAELPGLHRGGTNPAPCCHSGR